MSAGFDACNLNPVPLEFVSGTQNNTQPTEPQVAQSAAQAEVESENDSCDEVARSKPTPVSIPRNLQRVAEAREQQGFSLRTISRRTGIDLRTLLPRNAHCRSEAERIASMANGARSNWSTNNFIH